MTPGPNEPTAEELQNYLKLIVDDLENLYVNGLIVKTPSRPEGRRLRVALVALACDHPAMCKVSGFAEKNHTECPCTQCKAKRNEMFSDEGLNGGQSVSPPIPHHKPNPPPGFTARNGEEHKFHARRWAELQTDEERAAYFSLYGVRWSEFTRLSYFDPIRMTIIDPMHNLLLCMCFTSRLVDIHTH